VGRVAAYKLSYETSSTSGSSRLTSVQEYGTDAVLDSSGSITSGTSLPAHVMSYSTPASSFSTGITFSATTPHYVGDFNGDTQSDYANADTAGTTINGIYMNSTSAVYANPSERSSFSLLPSSATKLYVGDFTGDHRSDFLKFSGSSSAPKVEVYASSGSNFEIKSSATPGSVIWNAATSSPSRLVLGDFNGDGATDFGAFNYIFGKLRFHVMMLNSSGALSESKWITTFPSAAAGSTFASGDFNGDGKTDLFAYYISSSTWNGTILLSTGTGSVCRVGSAGANLSTPGRSGLSATTMAMAYQTRLTCLLPTP
jgi:hypothetical protein